MDADAVRLEHVLHSHLRSAQAGPSSVVALHGLRAICSQHPARRGQGQSEGPDLPRHVLQHELGVVPSELDGVRRVLEGALVLFLIAQILGWDGRLLEAGVLREQRAGVGLLGLPLIRA